MNNPRQTSTPAITAPRRGIAVRRSTFSVQRSAFILFLLALALRLLVWHWHALYPLGGDEREYLEQALTLLRERRYEELQLMRPPLYTVFLAASIYVFDSLVQRLRLVQAVIGALTVLPVYALTLRLFGERRIAFAAGLLFALNYTLAAAATELLSETLFLFGLALFFWLVVEAREVQGSKCNVQGEAATYGMPLLAGLVLGCLTLVRSVALPLLPLAALWLGVSAKCKMQNARTVVLLPLIFTFAFCILVAPWTLRNYVTYGALIVVDTTGAENLWLDNDPAGREAVKAQLYALGDDMAARQRLAAQRGVAVILADPGRFAAKAWGEAQRFFALQFFDDMRERRAIWVPPVEVWLRLILGDGLWLVTLLTGVAGLWLAPVAVRPAPRWLFVPWALYVLLTGLLFHVELRYRLPLYPVLLPYAGWVLVRIFDVGFTPTESPILERPRVGGWHVFGAALSVCVCVALLLLHRPYLSESWMLANKHLALWQAERALAAREQEAAERAGQVALVHDPDSALGHVALARAALLENDLIMAHAVLDDAVAAVPDHPQAHMLRGALLRALGETDQARSDLAYETATLDDAQRWAWETFGGLSPNSAVLDIGGGLDLGLVRGFHAAEPQGYRWTREMAEVRLVRPNQADVLDVRMASGRPHGVPAPRVSISANGVPLATVEPGVEWESYQFALPPGLAAEEQLIVTVRSDTFRPRQYHRASPDDRALGVMIDAIALAKR
jgi:4-amino-4-deoxy-L-arabinose transferase-like glycosyltransferase